MKYKYMMGVLVALNLGSALVAADFIDKHAQAYTALTSGAGTAAAKVNAALVGNKDFNHDTDANIVRGCSAGFELRKAVIGLDALELQNVVEANPEFFQTSLGMSLVYGWVMNKCDKVVTPYYIGRYFSFDKLFQGLADKVGDSYGPPTKALLSKAFRDGLNAVEASEDARWAFYHHLMYLPYAIEQVKAAQAVQADALLAPVVQPSMDALIAGARRTADEARGEAQALIAARAAQVAETERQRVAQQRAAAEEVERQRVALVAQQKAAAEETERQRVAKIKAEDLAVISTGGYMDYERNKAQYPKTAGDIVFQNFKTAMNKYSRGIPACAAAIKRLNELTLKQDLHGISGTFSTDGGYKYEDRRADIAQVLLALQKYLR